MIGRYVYKWCWIEISQTIVLFWSRIPKWIGDPNLSGSLIVDFWITLFLNLWRRHGERLMSKDGELISLKRSLRV